MQLSWRIGSLFGIPLIIDLSWFLILALVTIYNGQMWQSRYPSWGVVTAWSTGFAATLLLFISVLLHELGHSLVARAQGYRNGSISLFLFGGVASAEPESETPGKAFQVAIAGPAISLSLAAVLTLLHYLLPGAATPLAVLVANLALMNLVVALFNLLPGLPLDGGQILKAIVWKLTGHRLRGVRFAARTGEWLGWGAIAVGIADTFNLPNLPFSDSIEGWWLVLLGWFGLQAAKAYDRTAELQETVLETVAAEAMTSAFRVVDINLTLHQFTKEYLAQSQPILTYFAAAGDRHLGLVMVDDLSLVERSQWDVYSLAKILRPLSSQTTVRTDTSLVTVIQLMEAQHLPQIAVLSPEGTVAGMIDRGDIVRTVAHKLDIRVSESMIQQIKQDEGYPPNLPLPAIVQPLTTVSQSTTERSPASHAQVAARRSL